GQQRGNHPGEYRLVGEEGCARCSLTFVLQRTTLYFPERRRRFLSRGKNRRVVVQRAARSSGLLLLLAGGRRSKDLYSIRRRRRGCAGRRPQVEYTRDKQARWGDPGHSGASRRKHLRENRKSPVRFWKVKDARVARSNSDGPRPMELHLLMTWQG